MTSDRHRGGAPVFPPGFFWGAATAAYQIEGSTRADGRGASVWDHFCAQPGVIADGSSGEVACDHYRRWPEDVDLMRQMGLQAYRFSIAWPRVQPDGRGAWNERGLAFYERLVDALLAAGIQPHATLHHWDLPQALQESGGWPERDTAQRFVEYAVKIGERLGDRLASIATHNEPWVVTHLGHETGVFAPGLRDRRLAMAAAHHLLLSHGQALRALRHCGCAAPLGIVLNMAPVVAADATPEAEARARLEDGRLVRWYLEPVLLGRYPDDVLATLGADAPPIQQGDLAQIAAPLDFLGINYYSRMVVDAEGPLTRLVEDADGPCNARKHPGGYELTGMGWEVVPEGLTQLLVQLHDTYRLPPIVITENGAAYPDVVAPDGRVHDAARTRYLQLHVEALSLAIQRGVRVWGYMAWSLVDNFEWASGYGQRFGLVRVDYATQRRTLKDSALWYRDFIAQTHGQATAAPQGE